VLFRLHLGSSRQIQPGQKIHSSLLLARGEFAEKYKPIARPPTGDDSFWDMLRREDAIDDDGVREWLEIDLYEYAKMLVESMIKEDASTLKRPLHMPFTSA
jgi:hypothetical protein